MVAEVWDPASKRFILGTSIYHSASQTWATGVGRAFQVKLSVEEADKAFVESFQSFSEDKQTGFIALIEVTFTPSVAKRGEW